VPVDNVTPVIVVKSTVAPGVITDGAMVTLDPDVLRYLGTS
jgi:hypothetical protein